jgi:hypothetical protein
MDLLPASDFSRGSDFLFLALGWVLDLKLSLPVACRRAVVETSVSFFASGCRDLHANSRPKIAAALKDHPCVAVKNGLVPFVRFGASVGNQRAVVCRLAPVRVNFRIFRPDISILTRNLVFTVSLRDNAHSQSYKPGRHGSCHLPFDR